MQQTQHHQKCSQFVAQQAACTGQVVLPDQLVTAKPLFGVHQHDMLCGAMQAVRPDRLAAAMTSFVCNTLGLTSISPPSLSIATVLRQEATAGVGGTCIPRTSTSPTFTILNPSPPPSPPTTTKLLLSCNLSCSCCFHLTAPCCCFPLQKLDGQ